MEVLMERIEVATTLARECGTILKNGFGTTFTIESKEGKQNLVTEYDNKVEQFLISNIRRIFPDDAILAEESGKHSNTAAEYTWVIDPLDGTVNFAHGIPIFCVSIGVIKNGKPILGVVYIPLLNELFSATLGEGAFLNGKPIRVSNERNIEKALLSTGFPYNMNENPLGCIDQFGKCIKMGYPVRRMGSAAIDLCYVAAGRLEAHWECSLMPWDVAAALCILNESGGKTTREDGSERDIFSNNDILASNGSLHNTMIDILKL